MRLEASEAGQIAREIVQQVANEQSGIPDEDEPLEIEGEALERIVIEVLVAWFGAAKTA